MCGSWNFGSVSAKLSRQASALLAVLIMFKIFYTGTQSQPLIMWHVQKLQLLVEVCSILVTTLCPEIK